MFAILGAVLLAPAGAYLSAAAWGARIPPFRAEGERLYLIVPGQFLILAGALCGLSALGFSVRQVAEALSAILTHGGP